MLWKLAYLTQAGWWWGLEIGNGSRLLRLGNSKAGLTRCLHCRPIDPIMTPTHLSQNSYPLTGHDTYLQPHFMTQNGFESDRRVGVGSGGIEADLSQISKLEEGLQVPWGVRGS